MKIRRLHVTDFGTIRAADVEFGAGLNVLYGPNDLGKSTLADAIRLALLLPHTSAHIEDYVPWTGGQNPVVELTFETEAQRIWRVRKEFRKGGASILQESKNGVDFDEIERARKVDAKLREILSWGISEPGGAGGSKGLPSSFLATALLSTQADVTALLSESLSDDPSGSGRERLAAALQAVAQDPLFVSLLRETQTRRDQAYTEKGAKKTAKGSVFKEAADRVREVRDEKERLQKLVEDSEGVEQHLRELIGKRGQREEAVASATERVKTLEQLAVEAAVLSAAAEQVRIEREEVERIQEIDRDVQAAERNVKDLALKVAEAEEALKTAQNRLDDTKVTLETAEKAATADGSDPSTRDIVTRQALELRRIAAEQAGLEAQRRIDAALAAQKLVDVAAIAAGENQKRRVEADAAWSVLGEVTAKDQEANEQLRRLDLLECALETRAAEEQAATARTNFEQETLLRARLESEMRDRDGLAARRAAITVPPAASLGQMRRLANDLAGARGALNVGVVVTVTLQRPVDLRIQKDGTAPETMTTAQPMEIEANAEVDIVIGDVAQVRVRGGRREAQETALVFEKRWSEEIAPHLAASGVEDLDSLAAKVEDAQALDAAVKLKDTELESLRGQLASFGDSAEQLREALERVETCQVALGGVSLDSLASDLSALGSDPRTVLRVRRQKLTATLDAARATAAKASTAFTLASERSSTSQTALEAAIVARDAELARFPLSLITELSAAQAATATASEEQNTIAVELASLDNIIAEQTERIEAAISGARAAVGRARAELELAEGARTTVLKGHATEGGRLDAIRKQRESQDLQGAETRLREASDRHGALPVPERVVTETDVTAARNAEATLKSDLERIVSEINKTLGALEHVGGAVARERLRDAIEAFDLAELHEREIEVDYDAWLLLLQQMKEAEAAQASNLGQVLAPAIAGKFEALTQKRYENVRLTAQLGTEGIVVRGAIRSIERMSVGTREQLSTLYRLSLAEYLRSTVVLDDQLVQSDVTRMDWFRALLGEKARVFQIIVFTCRPSDYLQASAIVPKGKAVHKDTDGGSIRAVDLARAVQR
jgi:AAA domain